MKLTKGQINKLKKHEWDIVSTKVNGKEQNCKWLAVYPDDKSIFGEIVEDFGLTGDYECVKLLVVATQEED